MGDNGFITISGYDLYADNPDSRFNSPAEYKAKLDKQVTAASELLGKTGTPWTLGIPMSASAHEYEAYVPDPTGYHCGPACTPYNNSARMIDYVDQALDVVSAHPDIFQMSQESLFRGLTLWKWPQPGAPLSDFPKGSGNLWYPDAPAQDTLQLLKRRMPMVPR